jgi:hypothetical protein
MKALRIPLALLILTLGLLLQACGPKGPFSFLEPSHHAQEACGFVQNVYGERISWKGNTPIALYVHQSFPVEFYGSLQRAIKRWEDNVGHPLFQIISWNVPGPLNPRQDGVNMIYYMNTWEVDRGSEQARTSVYWVGDTVREADLRLNAHDFKFYDEIAQTSGEVHMESLLLHELGHILGLKHNDTKGSVMATYLSSLTIRNVIQGLDSSNLKCEY